MEILLTLSTIGVVVYTFSSSTQEKPKEPKEEPKEEPTKPPEEPKEEPTKPPEEPKEEPKDPITLCRIERKIWGDNNPYTKLPGKLAGLGERCSSNADCSANGLSSGNKKGDLTTLCGCDNGICSMRRRDYLGILFNPSECKKGLFDPPGSCVPNRDELPVKLAQKKERENWLNCK